MGSAIREGSLVAFAEQRRWTYGVIARWKGNPDRQALIVTQAHATAKMYVSERLLDPVETGLLMRDEAESIHADLTAFLVTKDGRALVREAMRLPHRESDGGRGDGNTTPNGQPPRSLAIRGRASTWTPALTRYVTRDERDIRDPETGMVIKSVKLAEAREIDMPELEYLRRAYPQYAEVLLAHEAGGESFAAIAERLAISTQNARIRNRRAKEKLEEVSGAETPKRQASI